MLRTLLVGILAVTAAAACSSKSEPPVAQPGVAAGKVLELSGKVTATRGTEVRTLAPGGEISSDDVIDTAADGRIAILVAHNNARWDLGPNKHGKLGDSLAWTAAKQEGPVAAVVEESSTAGAHAEKTAATTDTTTGERSEPATEVASDRKAMTRPAEPPQRGGESLPKKAAPLAQATPQAPPPAPSRTESTAPPLARDKEADATVEAHKETSAKVLLYDEGASAEERSIAPAVGGTSKGTSGPRADSDANDPVRQVERELNGRFGAMRTKLRACFEPTAPAVMIQLTVVKGVYTITTTSPAATDKARACLAAIAKPWTSATKLDQAVTVKRVLVKR